MSETESDFDRRWDARGIVHDALSRLRGCSWRDAVVIAYGPDNYLRFLRKERPKDYERIRDLYD